MDRKNKFKLGLALFLAISLSLTGCSNDLDSPAKEPVLESSETKKSDQALPLEYEEAKVVRVVDGDTLVVNFQDKEEKLRLIGMDTPESVHPNKSKNVPEGKIASDYVKDLVDGKDIKLEFDVEQRDRYGRLLAYVYLGNTMLNKHLLEIGYAKLATFPPNVKYVEDFKELQKNARENQEGFWESDLFTSKEKDSSKDSLNNKTSQSLKQSEKEEAKNRKFIGSTKSNKFHYPTCSWAKKIKSYNELYFLDREDAINQGYLPCGTCKP